MFVFTPCSHSSLSIYPRCKLPSTRDATAKIPRDEWSPSPRQGDKESSQGNQARPIYWYYCRCAGFRVGFSDIHLDAMIPVALAQVGTNRPNGAHGMFQGTALIRQCHGDVNIGPMQGEQNTSYTCIFTHKGPIASGRSSQRPSSLCKALD